MPIRIKGPTADRHPRRPWDSPERRKERQKDYMDRHGERPPRRKRLTPGTTQEPRKNLREKLKNLPKWKVQPKAVPAKTTKKSVPVPRTKKAAGGRIGLKKGTHPKGKTESSLKQSKKHAKTKYGVKDAFKPNFYPVRNREFRSWRTKKAEGKRVGGGTAKKTYHDKTTLAKSQRHPHSRLKTQKEYKAITDSATYKKADYHTKNKMLKKHPTTMKKGGRAGYYGGGRTRLLEELGRVEAEPSNRNRRAEISRVHGELNKGYKSGGAVLKGKKVGIQIK